MRAILVVFILAAASAATWATEALEPSPLAREISASELGGAMAGESEDAYARRATEAALRVERALRFGETGQEARGQLRQWLRIRAAEGATRADRATKKLDKSKTRGPKDPRGGKNAETPSGKGKRKK